MKNILNHSENATFNADKSKILSLVIHISDISHPAKKWDLHSNWTQLLMEEFFRQVSMNKFDKQSKKNNSNCLFVFRISYFVANVSKIKNLPFIVFVCVRVSKKGRPRKRTKTRLFAAVRQGNYARRGVTTGLVYNAHTVFCRYATLFFLCF